MYVTVPMNIYSHCLVCRISGVCEQVGYALTPGDSYGGEGVKGSALVPISLKDFYVHF